MRRCCVLLLSVLLFGCASGPGRTTFDPLSCDRNGSEEQRRAC